MATKQDIIKSSYGNNPLYNEEGQTKGPIANVTQYDGDPRKGGKPVDFISDGGDSKSSSATSTTEGYGPYDPYDDGVGGDGKIGEEPDDPTFGDPDAPDDNMGPEEPSDNPDDAGSGEDGLGDAGTGDTGGTDTGLNTGGNFIEPDMSASVDPIGDVAIPESTTGHDGYTEDDWLVEKRLEALYDRDSPFFEQARQQATRRHLASGGQNSAMAAAAGEGAAMETAFKVAFADAQTYAAFSQAEQKFIHNALLSDQAYKQAGELQQQRIEAQFEAIRLDFKGKSALMDKELDIWLDKARVEHSYKLDLEAKGFDRKMQLEGMLAMTQFYSDGVRAVFDATANLKNPSQQAESLRRGFELLSQQWDLGQAFWGQWAAGGPPIGG
jgi:hypothetical protein